jgi:hypothetical protein
MKLDDDERELASKDLHAFQLAEGALWRFLTFEADYFPAETDEFLGKVVLGANIEASSGEVTIGLAAVHPRRAGPQLRAQRSLAAQESERSGLIRGRSWRL